MTLMVLKKSPGEARWWIHWFRFRNMTSVFKVKICSLFDHYFIRFWNSVGIPSPYFWHSVFWSTFDVQWLCDCGHYAMEVQSSQVVACKLALSKCLAFSSPHKSCSGPIWPLSSPPGNLFQLFSKGGEQQWDWRTLHGLVGARMLPNAPSQLFRSVCGCSVQWGLVPFLPLIGIGPRSATTAPSVPPTTGRCFVGVGWVGLGRSNEAATAGLLGHDRRAGPPRGPSLCSPFDGFRRRGERNQFFLKGHFNYALAALAAPHTYSRSARPPPLSFSNFFQLNTVHKWLSSGTILPKNIFLSLTSSSFQEVAKWFQPGSRADSREIFCCWTFWK